MMRAMRWACAIGVLATVVGGASVAGAQATRTWVSGVGDDANPCSRTAPCKTFAGAISKTAVGGLIDCLDPGGFGQVTITKSITIDCDSGPGGILVGAGSGIVITGGSMTVTLRSLNIDGNGQCSNGVLINNSGATTVHVVDVNIKDCTVAGISVAASAAITLTVEDTKISECVNGIQTTSS